MVKVGTLGKAFVLCKGKVGLLFWNIVVVINRRGEIGDINTINILRTTIRCHTIILYLKMFLREG